MDRAADFGYMELSSSDSDFVDHVPIISKFEVGECSRMRKDKRIDLSVVKEEAFDCAFGCNGENTVMKEVEDLDLSKNPKKKEGIDFFLFYALCNLYCIIYIVN